MADQIKVLRPSGTTFVQGTVIGAANAHTAQNDNSDASYHASHWGFQAYGDLEDYLFPPGTRISAIWPVARARAHLLSEGSGRGYYVARLPGGVQPGAAPEIICLSETNQAYGGLISYAHPEGRPWNQADINTLQWWTASHAQVSWIRWTELYMYVYFNRRSFVVANSPATGLVIADKTQPTFAWGFGDWDGDVQEYYHLKIFSGTAAVANPETETARLIYDSGPVISGVNTLKILQSLANGQYTWAIKAADASSGQRWGGGNQLTYDEYSSETSVAGWTATNATLVRDTGIVNKLNGNAAMKLVCTVAGDITVRLNRFIPIDSLESAEIGAYFFPNTTLRTVCVAIEWYDAASVSVGFAISPNVAEIASQWNFAEVWATAPATAVKMKPVWRINAAAVGEIFWIDAGYTLLGTATKRYWSTETFEVNVPPPALPVMTLTQDIPNQKVSIAVAQGAGTAADWFEVMKSIDGGVTWEYVRGGKMMLPGASPLFDWEARRGASTSYRVKGWRWLAADHLEVSSTAWTATQSITLTSDGRTWLKHPFDSSLSIKIRTSYGSGENMSGTSSEAMAEWSPPGRSEFIVIGSDIQGEKLDAIPILFISDAEWEAFERLRRTRDPVLLQTRFGGASGLVEWWVRLGPDRTFMFVNVAALHSLGLGAGADQGRKVTVPAIQVKRPTVA